MNERIAAIRSRVMRSTGIPDPENQKLRAESFDQTADKSEVIREAKAIAHYFENRALVIHNDEMIIGFQVMGQGKFRGDIVKTILLKKDI